MTSFVLNSDSGGLQSATASHHGNLTHAQTVDSFFFFPPLPSVPALGTSGCARASRGVSLCLSVLIILLSSQWTEVGIEVVRKEEASGSNE